MAVVRDTAIGHIYLVRQNVFHLFLSKYIHRYITVEIYRSAIVLCFYWFVTVVVRCKATKRGDTRTLGRHSACWSAGARNVRINVQLLSYIALSRDAISTLFLHCCPTYASPASHCMRQCHGKHSASAVPSIRLSGDGAPRIFVSVRHTDPFVVPTFSNHPL